MVERGFSHSIVTYFGGSSYGISGARFVRNVPKKITSLRIRKKLNGVKGFDFRDHYKSEPEKSRPEMKRPDLNSETEVKKTVKKKKAVKKVKQEGNG